MGRGLFSWEGAQHFGRRCVLVRGGISLREEVCPSEKRQDLDGGGVFLDVA